jgi:hypothetical protein
MVYNTEDYKVFVLCPSSGIPKKHKRTQRYGNGICVHSIKFFHTIFPFPALVTVSWDSVEGIATDYGLEERGA